MDDQDINYRQVFQNSVDKYEQTTQTKHISLIYNLEKDVLERFFYEINSGDLSVMDFACGSGRWTKYLETKFKSTVGVDVSRKMIDSAKRKCCKTHFHVTDITSNNQVTLKQEFDVITAFRFYKNAEDELREEVTKVIPTYLKENGYFIFDLHLNTYSFNGVVANCIKALKLDKVTSIGKLTIRTISLGDIKQLFENTNLEIVDYWGMGVMPGRSNTTLLPFKVLYELEKYFTLKKLFRNISYNILVIARKISV